MILALAPEGIRVPVGFLFVLAMFTINRLDAKYGWLFRKVDAMACNIATRLLNNEDEDNDEEDEPAL